MLCLDNVKVFQSTNNSTSYWFVTLDLKSDVELTTDENNEIVVTFDECSNIENIDSEDLNMHDYYISAGTDDNGYTCEGRLYDAGYVDSAGTTHYLYLIEMYTNDPTTFLQFLDENVKYVRLHSGLIYTESGEAVEKAANIIYDPKALYHAEIRMLNTFCNTCLDDKQMQLIMLITFKRQLLEQAIACRHYREALLYYLDLCRILHIYVAKQCHGSQSDCGGCVMYAGNGCAKYENSSCVKLQNTCVNGMCSLC